MLGLAVCTPGELYDTATLESSFCIRCAELMYRPLTACALGLAVCTLRVYYALRGHTLESSFCTRRAELMHRPLSAYTLGLAVCSLRATPYTAKHLKLVFVFAGLRSCIVL